MEMKKAQEEYLLLLFFNVLVLLLSVFRGKKWLKIGSWKTT